MKRSEYIALGAVGLLAVATFWPRSQTPEPAADPALAAAAQNRDGFQTLAFANLAECKDSQAVTALICETEYGKASQQSVEDAPKYSALADCEAEYGASQCRPATWNGASVFIPALAGVLIARSLAGGAATSQPLYPPRTGPGACPPGVNTAERPECGARSSSGSSSSSSGGSGGSSGRRYYSTGTGRVVSRVGGAVIADMILPSRTSVSRSTVSRAGSSTSSWSSSGSSASRSSTPSYSSSSSTVSRGGFGSTSSSFSSGS